MIREAAARTALRLAGAFHRASQAVANRIGSRAGDHIEFAIEDWRIVRNAYDSSHGAHWTLVCRCDVDDHAELMRSMVSDGTYTEAEAAVLETRGRNVYEPRRFGNVVIACDFAPDGGGTTYVLDARMEALALRSSAGELVAATQGGNLNPTAFGVFGPTPKSVVAFDCEPNDAAFFAVARKGTLALIAEVRRLRAQLALAMPVLMLDALRRGPMVMVCLCGNESNTICDTCNGCEKCCVCDPKVQKR